MIAVTILYMFILIALLLPVIPRRQRYQVMVTDASGRPVLGPDKKPMYETHYRWAGASWVTLKPYDSAVIVTLNSQQSTVVEESPLTLVLWPVQKFRVYSREPRSIVIAQRLGIAFGGDKSYNVPLIAPRINYHVVDPIAAFWICPGKDPEKALRAIAASCITQAALRTSIIYIKEHGIDDFAQDILDSIEERIRGWGIEIDQIFVADYETPKPVLEYTEGILRAEADAEATRIRSAAEVEATQKEIETQGPWYGLKEFMQNLGSTNVQILGGDIMSALLNMGLNQQNKGKKE